MDSADAWMMSNNTMSVPIHLSDKGYDIVKLYLITK